MLDFGYTKLLKIIQDESNASSEMYILQNLKNLLRWKHVCQSLEIHGKLQSTENPQKIHVQGSF